ncbi:MAG: O-antigen ligase family protein [Planctomycetota bacterium]
MPASLPHDRDPDEPLSWNAVVPGPLPAAASPKHSRWKPVLGWTALLILLLLPPLPRRYVLIDLAAAVGVVLLIAHAVRGKGSFLPDGLLRLGAAVFLASATFSVLYPPLAQYPDLDGFLGSLHDYWATLRAVTGAGLCLLLLRKREDVAGLLAFLALFAAVIAVWALAECWLKGLLPLIFAGHARLTGTCGTAHRFASLLYLFSFALWMLVLTPSLRNGSLAAWARRTGYALAVLVPLLLLRKEIPAPLPESGWLPRGSLPALPASFYALSVLCIALGLLAWRCLSQPGWPRAGVSWAALILILPNQALAGARLHLGLTVLTGAAALILARGETHRYFKRSLVAGVLLALALLLSVPATLDMSSIRARQQVWRGAVEIFREHWMFGVGYGPRAFSRSWRLLQAKHTAAPSQSSPLAGGSPIENAAHAHNLWLELLAERGVVGFVAFHVWWASALWWILGQTRRKDTRPLGDMIPTRRSRENIPARLTLILFLFLAIDGCLNTPLMDVSEALFWGIAAIGLAATRGTHEKEDRENSGPTSLRGAANLSV